MEFALGAASVCISRSGASSLGEIAAMKLPSILIPYPTATDDHQFYNALAFVESGAAKMFQQSSADATELARTICELIENKNQRDEMQIALANWHSPDAAEKIADRILESISVSKPDFQKRAELFSNRIQRDSKIDSLRENFEQEATHV
jgi:UDP-N-acetylglucosamine--N-acetylmuramyl-(pentapeptide) pyrophosphoryl-undecaprenol N-acetylglucosamine transferase